MIQQSIFNELADFLVSQPRLEAIAAYQLPANIQTHIDNLLERIMRVVYRQMNAWNSKIFWLLLMSWI